MAYHVTPADIACAQTFYVGGTAQPGIPLLPMEENSTKDVAKRISRKIPELRQARSAAEADLVISVLFVPSLPICTDCGEKPKTEWSAIISVRSAPEQPAYFGTSGTIWIGSDVIGAFVEQLKRLVRAENCAG